MKNFMIAFVLSFVALTGCLAQVEPPAADTQVACVEINLGLNEMTRCEEGIRACPTTDVTSDILIRELPRGELCPTSHQPLGCRAGTHKIYAYDVLGGQYLDCTALGMVEITPAELGQ